MSEAKTAWYAFQAQVKAILDQHPVLLDTLPADVREAWEQGLAAINEILPWIVDGCFPLSEAV